MNISEVVVRARLPAIMWFCFVLLSAPFFLGGGQTVEQQEENQPQPPAFGSLQKSLLVPGWGQLAEKRYFEAAVFFGAELFCLSKIFSYNHKADTYYDSYKKADNTEDAVKYRKLTEKNDARRNQYMLAAFGVWAVNLADIYVIVKGKQSKRTGLRFWLDYRQEPKVGLVVSYRF
jgi:hypothetical protein